MYIILFDLIVFTTTLRYILFTIWWPTIWCWLRRTSSNLLEPCHCRDSNVCRVATRELRPQEQSWSFWSHNHETSWKWLQSWSFWSHNHETSVKMWKRALIFWPTIWCWLLALVTWTSTPKNESWSFWSHKHETSIKMWKRALIFGRERALVTWNSTSKTKVATKQAFVCSRSVCVKRLT